MLWAAQCWTPWTCSKQLTESVTLKHAFFLFPLKFSFCFILRWLLLSGPHQAECLNSGLILSKLIFPISICLHLKCSSKLFPVCAELTTWLGLPAAMMVKILMMIMCCHNYYLSELNITDVFPAVDDETELNSAIFTQNEWDTVPVESPAMGFTSKREPNVSVEGQLIWTSRGFGVRVFAVIYKSSGDWPNSPSY